MKKRDVFLFISFLTLFVLFAVFQNFSFPTKQLQNLNKKQFFQNQIQKFVPTYTFNSYIGENIEAPYGYKEEINRKIASQSAPVIFDDRKFIENEFKSLPVYNDIKRFIEISDPDVIPGKEACVIDKANVQNNCNVRNSTNPESMKLRANPLRQTASIYVPGDITSQMMYMGDKKSINVQFRKNLDKDAGVKLELDSHEQSGAIKFDVRW